MATQSRKQTTSRRRRVARKVGSELAIVLTAHTLAVAALMVVERVFPLLPCGR